MVNKVNRAQAARIDRFVRGLEGRTREIAIAYIRIPNTPDCQPEVLALHFKYGAQFKEVSGVVEQLRVELGLDYRSLQSELQKRLYD